MKKIFMKNRKNQNISVIIEQTTKQKGLTFVMHGLGGFKEQKHIETIAKAFKDNDYTVIRFDTTNTLGESDGNYENATTTNYYEDLEDVINWAKTQEWYEEPFCLSGHSLGGISVALYAENYPNKVKAVAPISPVISGKLNQENKDKQVLSDWKESGWLIKESHSKPGMIKKLKWSFMEDCLKHDLLPMAGKLTMPVLIIVGSEDTSTPVNHQKILFNALPQLKELHITEGAPHTFLDSKHLKEIYKIFNKWIKSL